MKERIKKISDKDLIEHFGEEDAALELSQKEEPATENKRKAEKSREGKESISPLDMDKVIFTTHSLERFADWWKVTDSNPFPENPEKTAHKLLAAAEEGGAISPSHKVVRMINNKRKMGELEPVRYFFNSGWRFVVLEKDGKYIVKTIERRERR